MIAKAVPGLRKYRAGFRRVAVLVLAVIALATVWDRPGSGQSQPVGSPWAAGVLLGTGGALDGSVGARSLATGGAPILTAPTCFPSTTSPEWCGRLMVTAPVLLATYQQYRSTLTVVPTTPQPGVWYTWYNDGQFFFQVNYDGSFQNCCPGTYGPPDCRYTVSVGQRLYWVGATSSVPMCGGSQTGGNLYTEDIVNLMWSRFRGAGGLNPGAPSQADANSWVRGEIDAGRWGTVVKPPLRQVIEAAVTWQDVKNKGIDREPKIVAVDAGHGQYCGRVPPAWNGVQGPPPLSLHEDDLVLDIAQRVALDLVAKGYRVIQTRPDNCYVYQRARVNRAMIGDPPGDAGPVDEIFVSVHLNSGCVENPDPTLPPICNQTANGTEVWIALSWPTYVRSASLALGIVRNQAGSLGLPYTTTGASGTPGLKWAGADSPWQGTVPTVLEGAGKNNWPAALSEVAFLTNPGQQQLLSGATYRQQAAMAISGAITRFFGPP